MPSRGKRILVVDDDPDIRRLLVSILRHEYDVLAVETGEAALERFVEYRPAILLLDVMLPGINGFEPCQRIRQSPSGRSLHIIIVSSQSSREEQLQGYQAGADDYVVKPIEPTEFLARVRLHFRLRMAGAEMASARAELAELSLNMSQLAAARDWQISATQDATVLALAKVAECRDDDTGSHLQRIGAYSEILALQLRSCSPYRNQINDEFMHDLLRGSPLHDIGKVGIVDSILLKPGPLTADEFERMKQHTTLGASLLELVVQQSPAGSFLSMAAVIARYHHERFDGTGYPSGLRGQAIPLPARIVAVADVYDSLTSQRPYKRAWSAEEARQWIIDQSGRHFDPVIVDAFKARYEDFLSARAAYDSATQVKPRNGFSIPLVEASLLSPIGARPLSGPYFSAAMDGVPAL
jgi:putative two-component system response regulator